MADALPIAEPTERDMARFWAKVNLLGENGCWNWTAAKTTGYGRFYLNGKLHPAHRVSWRWLRGHDVPTDLVLDHICKNEACVNPAHLQPVPQRVNVQIGRQARLNPDSVRAIRAAYAAGGITQRELGEQFGVSTSVIGYVLLNKIWTNVGSAA